MRISTGFLCGFMILAVVFASGCSNPVSSGSSSGSDVPVNFNFKPLLPSALTGDGTEVASRAIQVNDLLTEYNAMIMVPETAANYNGTIDNFYDQFLPVLETMSWNNYTEVGTDYTKELRVDDVDMKFIMRRNDDYSSFEYYLENPSDTPEPYASEQFYARIKSYPSYIHALMIFYHTSTNNAYDSVEMIQTKSKIYTKCLRLFNIDDSNSINTTTPTHTNIASFVGVTDLSGTNNNTTGMRKNEMLNSTGYAFTAALPTSPSFYYDPATNPNGQTFLYSYFNNSDNLVNTATEPSSGYISPTDPILLNIYDQGIQMADIGTLVLDQTNGTGGRSAWHDWDAEYLQ